MAKRGFYRKSPRRPEGPQIAELKAAGYTVLYTDSNTEDVMKFANSARKREVVGVQSLARLGSSREQIAAAVDKIFEKGGIIHETSTGRRSDNPRDMAAMAFEAADEIAADRRVLTPAQAKRYGKKGGRPVIEKMPDDEARPIWQNTKTYRRPEDALKHMPGWSQAVAYRELGARGAPAGRPIKHRRQ